jgi:hypothetical protein
MARVTDAAKAGAIVDAYKKLDIASSRLRRRYSHGTPIHARLSPDQMFSNVMAALG